MAWTSKVDFTDKILAADINALQTGKVDSDGTASPTFAGVKIGGNTPVQGAQMWVGYTYTAEAGWHAFEDETIIHNHGGHGYASFDAMPTAADAGPYDHVVGFQSRPIYASAGNAVRLTCFDAFSVHSGTGTVASAYGLQIWDVGGVGPITTDYGIYIPDIWRGATNFAIYSAGPTTKSYFAGPVGFGIAVPLDAVHVFHASAPNIRTSFTSTTGAGGFDLYNDGGIRGMAKILGTAYSLYGGASCFALINTGGPISACPSGLTAPTLFLTSGVSYLHAGTTDGSDNQYLELAGGGAGYVARGAYINLFGNEHAQKGSAAYVAGYGDSGANYGKHYFYGGAGPVLVCTISDIGDLTAIGKFGCNTKAAQGAYASGGALAGYVTGAFGLDSDAHMSALHAMVVAIRAALVADGIMS
jgi:hypothetical protein